MNPFTMMKDAKNMEKMMKPALEKFMKEAGFIKKDEIEPLKRRIAELESEVSKLKSYKKKSFLGSLKWHGRIELLLMLLKLLLVSIRIRLKI